MQLKPRVGDALEFKSIEVQIERNLGSTVQCTVFVERNGLELNQNIAKIANAIESGDVEASLQTESGSILPEGVRAVLVGGDWNRGRRARIGLKLCCTSFDRAREKDDPLIPRFRVHKGANLKEILEGLPTVAKLTKNVATEVEKVEFEDQDHACVIQDGLSDVDVFKCLLEGLVALHTGPAYAMPVLTGGMSVAEQTAGRWAVVWGGKGAYDGDYVESHLLDDEEFEISKIGSTEHCSANFAIPHGHHASVFRRRPDREFEQAKWVDEVHTDLPLFNKSGKHCVNRIIDVLQVRGRNLRWTTRFSTIPDRLSITPRIARRPLGPWAGSGKIIKSSKKGPWLEIELPGFEEGYKTLHAKLSTPYSGSDGKKGLHLVPDVGTRVLVSTHGLIPGASGVEATATVVANVRDEEVEFDSPGLELDKPATVRVSDVSYEEVGKVTVKKIGEVAVNSALTTKVSGALSIDSGMQSLTISGGGRSIAMANNQISNA